MLLKEFDLDIPYIKNELEIKRLMQQGLSNKEAIRNDYDENWKWKRARFRLENRCMMAMFNRLFKPIRTGFWKILVECVPEKIIKEDILVVGNICEVQVPFDYDKYYRFDSYKKKVKAIELLYSGIERVCDKNGWEITPFRNVRDVITKLEYKNHWFIGKKIKSPDRKHSAQIYLEHEPEAIYIYMAVHNKIGNIEKYLLISENPSEFAFSLLLGGIEWEGNNRVSLICRQKDKSFTVNLE